MANPVLNENTFLEQNYTQYAMSDTMTKNGVMTKSAGLLFLTVVVAACTWYKALSMPQILGPLALVGTICGFITGLILAFNRRHAQYLAPLYAVFEGLVIGAVSLLFEKEYSGIVYQSVVGTFAVLFTMLAMYSSRIIVVTDKLRSTIIAATVSIAVVYLVSFILFLFGINVPFINDASPIGIGISLIVLCVAAFNFLLDFDNIERGINANAPKYYEWYCSFGLLVTLIWVYWEILRLLSKLRRSR